MNPQTDLLKAFVRALLGRETASPLMTDAYKAAMAQAGFPLREETFVLTLRKGGPFYIPFELKELVPLLVPAQPTKDEQEWLEKFGYGYTPAMCKALQGRLTVLAPPVGSWVGAGAPICTVTGPSFLVSFLEPLLLMLSYSIQIATAMKQGERHFYTSCPEEAELLVVLARMQNVPTLHGKDALCLEMDNAWQDNLRVSISKISEALKGELDRAFEVGLRSATCYMHHLDVLRICLSSGLLATSDLYGAKLFSMIPKGTTGHEHQMRWDVDDRIGYRAVRDMRPGMPSYLFDTTDPITMGLPAAFDVIAENPEQKCALRFDSGNQDEQFLMIQRHFKKYNFERPLLIFEDSYTAEKTLVNEAFCELHGWPQNLRAYGYGGYLVSGPLKTPYNRDRVSAAYKLAKTADQPVRKKGGNPDGSKASLPGIPILLQSEQDPCLHLVAQWGERAAGFGFVKPSDQAPTGPIVLIKSRDTQLIIGHLEKKVAEAAENF